MTDDDDFRDYVLAILNDIVAKGPSGMTSKDCAFVAEGLRASADAGDQKALKLLRGLADLGAGEIVEWLKEYRSN
jgi:hypothetical protein